MVFRRTGLWLSGWGTRECLTCAFKKGKLFSQGRACWQVSWFGGFLVLWMRSYSLRLCHRHCGCCIKTRGALAQLPSWKQTTKCTCWPESGVVQPWQPLCKRKPKDSRKNYRMFLKVILVLIIFHWNADWILSFVTQHRWCQPTTEGPRVCGYRGWCKWM